MYAIIKTVGGLSASLPSDTQICLTRHFRAPRQMVWDAHTQPTLLRQWLTGPPGWTMPVCEVDLRVGGRYRYEWHNTAGLAMALSGTYREIDVPQRLADTQAFDDDWTQGPADTVLVFTESDGGTALELLITYASEAARDFALSTPMMEGMEAGYVKMDVLAET